MKPKSLTRPSELVLSAIYNLNEENGSSVKDIVDYISGNYSLNTEEIEQKVEAALKRGLSFGLISKDTSGLYKLRDIIQLPEVPTPQRVRCKRKKLARLRKDGNAEPGQTKVDEGYTKKNESVPCSEKYKRARMEPGGKNKNQGVNLDNTYRSTKLSSKRR